MRQELDLGAKSLCSYLSQLPGRRPRQTLPVPTLSHITDKGADTEADREGFEWKSPKNRFGQASISHSTRHRAQH